MKLYIIFLGVVLSFAACRSNESKVEQAKIDTLSYTYDSLKSISPVTAKNYQDVEDTTYVKIVYPKFANNKLNESIKKQILNGYGPEEPAKSIEELASNFIKGYETFRKDMPERPQTWYLNVNLKVLHQNPNYLCIEFRSEEYAGGAHGNMFISYLNYDPKTIAPLILDDFLLPNSNNELVQIAEKKFRENEKLTPTQNLENYFFENAKFSLAANYKLDDKGLVFLYNNYEIKPYADGLTTLILPYEDIMHLLKPIYKPQNIK